MPQAILMPIIGILMVTSEWSQRTGLTTFVLEPRRSRVTQAKIGAAVLLGVAMVTFAMAVGALATLLSQVIRGGDPSWSVSALSLGGINFGQLVGVLMGLAFGMVLQNSPAAIVAYLGLPTLWSILGQLVQLSPYLANDLAHLAAKSSQAQDRGQKIDGRSHQSSQRFLDAICRS